MSTNTQTMIKAASSLIGLQLFSRLFTFILNQALFRMVSPSAFGTAAIQFELLSSTILFISREGVRNAILRVRKAGTNTENVTMIPLLLGLPLAILSSAIYINLASQETRIQPYFTTSIVIYAFSAVLELLSEPMHNKAMVQLETPVRVRAEGLGITNKTLVTFLVLLYDSKHWALLAFAAGQFAYALSLLVVYVSHYHQLTFFPQKIDGQAYFDRDILNLSFEMTKQSFLKHLLTEGDKVILSWFSPLKDQGGYALAVNYGSLIARIVFQPIEETLRLYFSKTLPDASGAESGSESREKPDPSAKRTALNQAANTLTSLLSVQLSFSLLLLVFGAPYLPLFLKVILPPQYLATSAPKVLAAWVWYIPVLAVNGGLEAFFASAASADDLTWQSLFLVLFSAIYLAASVFFYNFTTLGDSALVYSNILNLSMRILYVVHFTSSFYSQRHGSGVLKWRRVLPNPIFVLVCSLSAIVIHLNGKKLDVNENITGRELFRRRDVIRHVMVGSVLGVLSLSTWWITSGRHLVKGMRKVKKQ